MSTEQSVEEIALEQRAADPRLEQNTETSVDNTSEEPAEQEAQVEEQPTPPVQKPKKTAEEVLKGRVGHLTKTLSQKDEELQTFKSQLEAATALLAAKESSSDERPNVSPTVTNTNPVYSKAEFDAAVAAKAAIDEFNRKADEMYDNGASKYDDWKDAIDTLVVSGFMNKDFIDAAMAVEDGTAVLHYLGTNLDEAERIGSLSPIRKAAEMAKLSNTLSVPKNIPVSSAPTPIKPVSGSASPQLDLQRIADNEDMVAYAAARAKQGSRWAKGRA